MRVFSVEMLVKEEGAAVVEAALKKLKKEAQGVSADLKVTTTTATGFGKQAATAGEATKIAGDRAAKAAVGFAAVGQAFARTGSLTADMGTRIIEAGSQISMMFGPKGLAIAALLSFAAAAATSFFKASTEAKKMEEDFKKSLQNIVNAGDVMALTKQLRELEQGTAFGAVEVDDLGKAIVNTNDGLVAMRARLAELQTSGFLEFNKENRDEAARLTTEIAAAEQKAKLLRDAIINAPTPAGDGLAGAITITGRAAATASEQMRQYEEAVKRNFEAQGALQARRDAGLGTMPDFLKANLDIGTGLGVAGITEKMGLAAAPDVVKQQADALKASIASEMTALTTDLANMPIAMDEALLDAIRVDNLHASLSEGISGALEGGILSGLEMALASGNIGEAFRAMGQAIVSSLAKAMVNVAIAAIKLGTLLEKVRAFMMLNPAIAVASAVALLALARSMGGGATGGTMTGVGGATGLSYAVGGASAPSVQNPIIFGGTSATTAAGMTARPNMNVTIIGPNDPTAQRAMQELMNKANSRGTVG